VHLNVVRRLVVACEDGMEILKINMPTSTK
jgi:hypothetical protein